MKNIRSTLEFAANRFALWAWAALLLGVVAPFSVPLADTFELEPGSIYVDPGNGFKFKVVGADWKIIEQGTISDGTSEIELQGPISTMSFIVFKYDFSETMDEISRHRTTQADENLFGQTCTETRTLENEKLAVRSYIECTGKSRGADAITLSTFVESKNQIYEFYGRMSGTSRTFERYVEIMRDMSKGFESP